MRTIERACVALLFVVLSACSGGSAPTAAQPAPPPAELVEGDLRIIATIVPTTALQERVTRGYGIARGEDTWMLLVTVRRGPEGKDTSVPAKVDASARDLQGRRIGIPMHALTTADGLVDSVGTFAFTGPDTLQFNVLVTPQGETTRTLDFARDIPK